MVGRPKERGLGGRAPLFPWSLEFCEQLGHGHAMLVLSQEEEEQQEQALAFAFAFASAL